MAPADDTKLDRNRINSKGPASDNESFINELSHLAPVFDVSRLRPVLTLCLQRCASSAMGRLSFTPCFSQVIRSATDPQTV
jgi:hypothetical protein